MNGPASEGVHSAFDWKGSRPWPGVAALVCTLTWLGYRLVYAQFQSYDDEGYLLLTVQEFLRGVPLYDQVYTQYGPAYYLWQQILHAVVGIPLTHDATRLVTLAIWLVCSVLAAVPVWLLTRRSSLTAIAITLAFIHLMPLTFEPGHPQELCLLSVLGVVVIALWRVLVYGNVGVASAVLIGVLIAVASLTKVNIGVFLVCAITLALVTSAHGFWAGRFGLGVIVLAVVLGIVVPFRNHLLRSDVAAFLVVIGNGLFAALLADRATPTRKGIVTIRELVACAAGLAIGTAGIVSAIIYQGTTLHGLFDGLLVVPIHFTTDLFWTRVPVSPAAAWISFVWLIGAWCLRRNSSSVRRWMSYANITMARVVCLLSVTNWFNPLLAVGPPFASAVLADSSQDPRRRAALRVLAFAAILLALQAYPMPGTQVALGTLLLVPIALMLIPDAEHALKAYRTATRASLSGLGASGLTAVAVLGIIAGVRIQQSTSSGIALRMPGAEKVRSREGEVTAYHWLAANLREHCDRFITAPGFNSLHLWTGIPPVSSLNTTVWPVLLDNVRQQQIVDAAAHVKRLCIVASRPAMQHLLGGPDSASRPLARYIAREFETRASYGEWEFRVRLGQQPALVNQARWIERGDLVLELPELSNQRIRRIEVVDLDASRTLVDSAADRRLAVFDEHNAKLEIDDEIDLSNRRQLVVRNVVPPANMEHTVVVRLWGSGDRLVATLPVVTVAAEVTAKFVGT